MKNVTTIDFKELESLRSRAIVRRALENAGNSRTIRVDFKNIKFLSRTSAHELLKIKDSFAARDIDVSFINLDHQTSKMIQIVEKSFSNPKNSDLRFVKWLTFKNEDQYTNYLLNIE